MEDYLLRYKDHLKNNYRVSETEWNILKELLKVVPVAKNEYYVKQGKVCRSIGYLAMGVMRYCTFREDGEDLTCYFMHENDFVGDPKSLETQQPSELNAQALTDCILITISLEDIQQLVKKLPRAIEVHTAINYDVTKGLTDQKTFMLGRDAASRYREFMKRFPDILQRVPLNYVAAFLGITQQSLSRLRKQIS